MDGYGLVERGSEFLPFFADVINKWSFGLYFELFPNSQKYQDFWMFPNSWKRGEIGIFEY